MNIVTTVPLSKYRSWEDCQADLLASDGSPEGGFWLVNTMNLPKKAGIDDLCYIVYAGFVRGYFFIIDTGTSESFRSVHRIGKRRITSGIQLCTWREIDRPVAMTGFQGWRYTPLRP